MSKLITTITVGAVSTLIAFAAIAEHEGGAGMQGFSPNTGAGFTGQQESDNIDESRWIKQRADREFAIAEQDCATLKYSSPDQFDPCMQQAEAARQKTIHSGGESLAANQGEQRGGQDKGTGIMEKVTDKVAEVTKAVTETLGFGAEKAGQHGVSGQSSQGAFPQQGHMPGQGGQSAQHAYTPGHGGYVPHGVLDKNVYALTMANREHSIKHQECETIKRTDPQGYEHCLEQANAAWEALLRSGFSTENKEGQKSTPAGDPQASL